MKKRDFHIHTIYSGHSAPDMTIKNIIQVAAERGMDEIAITEHSFDWHLVVLGVTPSLLTFLFTVIYFINKIKN